MTRHLCLAVAFLLIAAAPAANPPERTTTTDDRDSVNVTVYNGGTALIHDRRRVDLDSGLNRIAWRDVSAQIDATSALLDSPGGDARVLEQNFDYDLLDPQALLRKYVGRDVTVVHDHGVRETATVLSANDGGVVLKYADRIETSVRGYVTFPTSMEGFRDRPTLVLDIDSERAGSEMLDLSYLTGGMTWRADYVGTLTDNESRLAITGLVTISNQSGAAYEDAHLQLVAGNVNVAEQAPPNQAYSAMKTIASVVPRPSEENYFEYHLYTFPRQTTISNNQTKQLTLLSAHGVPIRKTLELRGSSYYYQGQNADLGDRLPVGVYVSFDNRGGDLGIPLPGGIVRIYESDSRGTSQFLGSDRIDHTPRNETVRLHLGDSFDVTARKKQTNFAFAGGCTTDSSYQVVLGNAKDVEQDVLVVEPLPAQWSITAENMPHAKTSSSTATWTVPVPPNSHTTLTYTAHVTWCE